MERTCVSPAGRSEVRADTLHHAKNTPATPPSSPRIALSVSSWRAMRRWLAPSAIRTAISLDREVARARSRFAILAQAIKSTSPAALKSRSSGFFTSPTITCCSGSIGDAPSFLLRKLTGQPSADSLQFRSCLIRGDAGPQPGNHREPVCLRRPRHPATEQRVLDKGYPDLLRLIEEGCAEAARHHANHGAGTLIERYRGAHNSRVGSESIAPQLFAQNRHWRSAALTVF